MSIIAINAKHSEEIRAAVLTSYKNNNNNNNKREVSNLYIESTFKSASLKDIYAGIVRSITPGMGAAFVEYGPGRHGFLPFRDIAPEYRSNADTKDSKSILKVGQSIIVQVIKEEREKKGAMLTTYVSLPGAYLVLMPNRSTGGGVSKQIDMNLRRNMRQISHQLNLPANMSVILRTAGADKSIEDLQEDLNLLLQQWEAIQKAFKEKKAPFLIFQEVDILARTIRDYVRQDSTEIIVDDPKVFEKIKFYANEIRPEMLDKIRLYEAQKPLFLHLDIEDEVESAFQNVVHLPSGGSIIFGRTEVGTSVDVNSASATQHADIHATALSTNLEAAEVIAKQLRWRDVGGLILIDFISMKEDLHRQQIEEKLREYTQADRARIQISNILPQFDVLVMSRQRLRPQLGKTNEDLCPTCEGSGLLRSIESLALSIIRTIEKRLFLNKAKQIRIEASVELIAYLSNEKRASICKLEQDYTAAVTLLPNPYWNISRYKITELNDESLESENETTPVSYSLITDSSKEIATESKHIKSVNPAVERFTKRANTSEPKLGFVGKIFNKIVKWGKTQNSNISSPPLTNDRRPNKIRRIPGNVSTNLRTKKPSRVLPLNVVNKDERVTSENIEKTVKKPLSKNNLSINVDQKQPQKQVKKQPVSYADKALVVTSNENKGRPQVDVKPVNISLGNPQPFKRSTVNRYGKEPRLQHRGY